jgi:predicted dehydrogenase
MSSVNRRQFLSIAAVAPMVAGGGAAAPGKKFRACVIGDSQQGGYGHSLHLLWGLREDVAVVGLADPDEKGRKRHGEQAKAKRLYADYRVMLEKERPDLVAIGPRWTTNHKEYLLACAEVGAHGILEKPLMSDLAEADEALAALDAKGLKWAIAFNFRASPVVDHAKKLIFEEGLIGEVLEVRSRGKEDNRAGGEDLIVLGTHIFDLMRYFLGDPEWCEADAYMAGRVATKADAREATEPLGPIVGDTIHAKYHFPNNIPAYFSSVKNAHGNRNRWGLEIHGTLGMVNMRMAPVPPILVWKNPSWAPENKSVPWEPLPNLPDIPHRGGHVGHYAPIIDDLIDSIVEDRRPRVSIHDGRDALAMVQAVFESSVNHKRITFPLENREHPLAP